MPLAMKRLLPLLLVCVAATALAQEGRRPHGPGARGQPGMQHPMRPGGGMSGEERQRLRDELKSTRREGWRQDGRPPQFDPRRRPPPPMPPEERERLRRDIRDANRDLGWRR